jgi:hypothetical protein
MPHCIAETHHQKDDPMPTHYSHQLKLTRLPARQRRSVLQVTIAFEHETGNQYVRLYPFPDPGYLDGNERKSGRTANTVGGCDNYIHDVTYEQRVLEVYRWFNQLVVAYRIPVGIVHDAFMGIKEYANHRIE